MRSIHKLAVVSVIFASTQSVWAEAVPWAVRVHARSELGTGEYFYLTWIDWPAWGFSRELPAGSITDPVSGNLIGEFLGGRVEFQHGMTSTMEFRAGATDTQFTIDAFTFPRWGAWKDLDWPQTYPVSTHLFARWSIEDANGDGGRIGEFLGSGYIRAIASAGNHSREWQVLGGTTSADPHGFMSYESSFIDHWISEGGGNGSVTAEMTNYAAFGLTAGDRGQFDASIDVVPAPSATIVTWIAVLGARRCRRR